MPMDKFKAYVSAATFRKVVNRTSYIFDMVAIISGLFGKKDNKIISNQIKSLEM